MKNPKLNAEGYHDPTAYLGMREVIKEESDADKRAYALIKVIKYIVVLSGFELLERVCVKDVRTGREYK